MNNLNKSLLLSIFILSFYTTKTQAMYAQKPYLGLVSKNGDYSFHIVASKAESGIKGKLYKGNQLLIELENISPYHIFSMKSIFVIDLNGKGALFRLNDGQKISNDYYKVNLDFESDKKVPENFSDKKSVNRHFTIGEGQNEIFKFTVGGEYDEKRKEFIGKKTIKLNAETGKEV